MTWSDQWRQPLLAGALSASPYADRRELWVWSKRLKGEAIRGIDSDGLRGALPSLLSFLLIEVGGLGVP